MTAKQSAAGDGDNEPHVTLGRIAWILAQAEEPQAKKKRCDATYLPHYASYKHSYEVMGSVFRLTN